MLSKNTFNKINVLIVSFICFSSACGCEESVESSNKEQVQVITSVAPKKDSTSFVSLLNKPKSNIEYNVIELIEFKKATEITTDKSKKSCKKWEFDLLTFKKILSLSNPISEAEKHYLYDIKLCSFEGKFKYKNEVLLFATNGGGWTTLVNQIEKDYLLLGCNVKECESYFISRGNEPSE